VCRNWTVSKSSTPCPELVMYRTGPNPNQPVSLRYKRVDHFGTVFGPFWYIMKSGCKKTHNGMCVWVHKITYWISEIFRIVLFSVRIIWMLCTKPLATHSRQYLSLLTYALWLQLHTVDMYSDDLNHQHMASLVCSSQHQNIRMLFLCTEIMFKLTLL